jgi:alpha-tubulin suppressor-like RCC1 family protein
VISLSRAAPALAAILLSALPIRGAELTNVAHIGGTCAIKDTGALTCWAGPQPPPDLGSIAAVATASSIFIVSHDFSEYTTCALTTGGAVSCGSFLNSGPQLGPGSSSLASGVVAIGVSLRFVCAVTGSGGVKCWGRNDSGQLGDGTTISRDQPVDVIGLAQNATNVAVGSAHACALGAAGGVECWGANTSGQLGDGTTTSRTTPAPVTGLSSGVAAIAAGVSHTCAVLSNGMVKCWGTGNQLGNGSSFPAIATTPVDVTGLTDAVAIAAGDGHTCALTAGGGVRCWGFGAIGGGLYTSVASVPVPVLGLSSGVIAITATASTSCALLSGGTVRCWGRNDVGQVGNGWFIYRDDTGWPIPARVGQLARQDLAFQAIADQPLGSPPFEVTVTASSRLPATLTSMTPGVCAASGSTVSLLSQGICKILATQDGDAFYGTAKPLLMQFAVFDSHASRLTNISTRAQVLTGVDVLVAGFIIEGTATKRVAVVVTGPSLSQYGVAGALSDPVLTVHRQGNSTPVAYNDNWRSAQNYQEAEALGFAPPDVLESAVILDLVPGAYTATVTGFNNATGVALVAVYEIDRPGHPLINISTRGHVGTVADVMIGGFIVEGSDPLTVAVVATGPSLANYGIANPLANPRLTLVRMSDSAVIASNDDWGTAANAAELQASGFAPPNALEPGILVTLPPGKYTAILEGSDGGTGTALLAVYAVTP